MKNQGIPRKSEKFMAAVIILSVLSFVPLRVQAQGGVEISTKNPQQIALLHWYNANQTTTFAVGISPTGGGL